MSDVLTAALTLLLATNRPAALTNLVVERTGLAAFVVNTNDPVARELQSIMGADDAAQEEISKLVDETENPKDPLLAPQPMTLRGRMLQRVEPVKQRYEQFIRDHPKYAKGEMAYGSFLYDLGEEDEAVEHWEKARELDPKDPAAWNNLANVYAHHGPVEKSFPYYDEAIRLNPNEPVYLHNFGTLVFLFRRDATNYFKCDEQAVFRRAFELYQKAIALDPGNFQLAADVAQTYYGWNLPTFPVPGEAHVAEEKLAETALKAWTNALSIASSDEEREGVYLHFARWNMRVGRFDDARTNLDTVTNAVHLAVRDRLAQSLAARQKAAGVK
jgi:tetratricopeptide (TPR) repeat protein